MNANALAVTGTPTLATGALTADTDQALTFNGTTNSAAATDSASLSIANSLSIELFAKLAAYPGSTQAIVTKSGSYSVSVTSAGLVVFTIIGPSVTTTLTSNVALGTNVFNHIVCVYNAGLGGIGGAGWDDLWGSAWGGSPPPNTQYFGKATNGAIQVQVDDGDGDNTAVTSTTLLEQALLRSVTLSLQYFDEIWPVSMSAVVYADNAGLPGALVTKSDPLTLSPPLPAWRSPTWVRFTLTPIVVPAGTYHIGYVADTLFGGPGSKPVLSIGADSAGGNTSYQGGDNPDSPPSPFGARSRNTANVLAAYCDYNATSRTGLEGKALIYINGALNVSTPRTDTIVDSTNSLQICPSLAATVDEVSIWNKPLSPVQIATHYTAH